MSLTDRFKSKKMVAIGYTKADIEELLRMELTELEFTKIRVAWNESVDELNLKPVDEIFIEWFNDHFKVSIEQIKKP